MFKSLYRLNFLNYIQKATQPILFRYQHTFRSHLTSEISLKDEGKNVQICGWVQSIRFNKFLIIRDTNGLIQINIPENQTNSSLVKDLTIESVIKVNGIVRRRPENQQNKKMSTGDIEIECGQIEILNKCNPKLPFQVSEHFNINEQLRLKYRYLDLRNRQMQENIKFRSEFVHSLRKFLSSQRFNDIETPTLFRRTPGGAREFIVPTRYDKKFYCLTQSPQQFKQLLMVAGFDRYYQIARCYRDEELRADRQPEFTQVDLEMSFVTEDDVINLIESLFKNCWPFEGINLPFRRMTFNDAIRLYGSDKPDLRFDLKFTQLTDIFRNNQTGVNKVDSLGNQINAYGFKIPLEWSNEKVLGINAIEKQYQNFIKEEKINAEDFKMLIFCKDKTNHIGKFFDQKLKQKIDEIMAINNDVTVILVGKYEDQLLNYFGKFRLFIANFIDIENLKLDSNAKLLRDPNRFEFEWIVDFPLFTYNPQTNQYESTHHPFTAPKNEHLDWVKSKKNLNKIMGQHYDLVLNGNEIAGGSIRIHNSDLQRFVLKEILNENTSPLEHLIEALEYGAPPHGGIAIGLDRLMAIMCKTTNIRNVIAFPKTSFGRDIMSDAPAQLPKDELDFYKIKFTTDDENNANKMH